MIRETIMLSRTMLKKFIGENLRAILILNWEHRNLTLQYSCIPFDLIGH